MVNLDGLSMDSHSRLKPERVEWMLEVREGNCLRDSRLGQSFDGALHKQGPQW